MESLTKLSLWIRGWLHYYYVMYGYLVPVFLAWIVSTFLLYLANTPKLTSIVAGIVIAIATFLAGVYADTKAYHAYRAGQHSKKQS